MIIGPVFTREAITAPRRVAFFVLRVLLVAALLGLALTAWQVTVGAGSLEGPGELARFGALLFALLAPLVLTLGVLFSALLAAAAVSQEKSRGTLVLLLLTDLRSSELVLGRLLASLLTVFVSALVSVPFFFALALLGGIDFEQIARVMAVVVAASLVAGSIGSTLALWREKTFQALALTALALVLWLAAGEAIAAWDSQDRGLASLVSPWRALAAAAASSLPASQEQHPGALDATPLTRLLATNPAAGFVGCAAVAVSLLNGVAIWRLRVWNPSREARPAVRPTESSVADTPGHTSPGGEPAVVGRARGQEASVHSAGGRRREVWDNPVLWREVRTWAYGKKVLAVKVAYVAIFALCAGAAVQQVDSADLARRGVIPAGAGPVAPLLVVSLVLVNALAVTSLTGERDGKSLDLLLATDLSPRELIFGKLGGACWNAREMIVLPLLLFGYFAWIGTLTPWLFALLAIGLLVLDAFAAMLGLHAAMMYVSSRRAIGVSVGTLLFLFLGVSTCMRIMLALSGTFEYQLAPFLGFIAGGGVALFAALGWRNPSTAMALASFSAPLAAFYAIVSFLLGSYSLVALVTTLTFGFATAAMLIPALSEFDIATGAAPTRED